MAPAIPSHDSHVTGGASGSFSCNINQLKISPHAAAATHGFFLTVGIKGHEASSHLGAFFALKKLEKKF
jgi:hypothetical protein